MLGGMRARCSFYYRHAELPGIFVDALMACPGGKDIHIAEETGYRFSVPTWGSSSFCHIWTGRRTDASHFVPLVKSCIRHSAPLF